MRKKLIAILGLVFTLLLSVATITACKNDNEEETPQGTASVSINAEEINLDQYETFRLIAAVQGTQQAVTWSSSDDEIASVEDGLVTGLASGEVKITAAVGDASAECKVTVYRSGYAPVLEVDHNEVAISDGGEYKVSPFVTLGGVKMSDDLDYSWGFAEGADEGVVSVTPNANGSVTFKAKKVGTTELYVTTTARRVLLAKKVTVTVADDSVILIATNLKSGAGAYRVDLGLATIGGYTTSVTPDFIVYDKGQNVSAPSLQWTTEDKGVVTEENGVLTAASVGTETVTVSYGETNVRIAVSVVKPVITSTENYLIETYRTTSLTIAEDLIGTFESATLGGEEIATGYESGVLTLDTNSLPTSSKDMGAGKTLIVETDKVVLEATASVYSMVIKTAADLDEMGSAMTVVEPNRLWDGYFLLGSDIDYNREYSGYVNYAALNALNTAAGKHWANGDENGFMGVFDGQGFNIDGITIGSNAAGKQYESVFGVLHTGSVIKNVSFTNVTLRYDGALICQGGDGVCENIYVKYSKLVRGEGKLMGTFFLNNDYVKELDSSGNETANWIHKNHNARVYNSFIDARGLILEGPANATVRLIGTKRYLQILNNGNADRIFNAVYLLCDDESLCETSVGSNFYNENNVAAYLNLDDLKAGNFVRLLPQSDAGQVTDAAAKIAKWETTDGVWTIAGGMPIFKNLVERFMDEEIGFGEMNKTVFTGNSFDLVVEGSFISLSLDQSALAQGVSLNGIRVTVPANCTLSTITVTVKSLFDALKYDSVTFNVRSVSSVTSGTRAEVDLAASVVNGAITPSATATTTIDLDLSALIINLGTLVGVRDKDGNTLDINKFTLNGKTLTISASAFSAETFGETQIVLLTEGTFRNYEVTVPLFVITKVVKTAADMNGLMFTGTDIIGYYVLGNDIDYTGVELTNYSAGNPENKGFMATFDGRNHTIKNYKQVNAGGMQCLFGLLRNATIKNVKFDANVTINAWNNSALFAVYMFNSTIENVTIEKCALTTNNTGANGGVLVGSFMQGSTFKNVTITMSGFLNGLIGKNGSNYTVSVNTFVNVNVYNATTVHRIIRANNDGTNNADVYSACTGLKIYSDNGTTEYTF